MWSASIVPDKRTDWRFIDFGLGLMESIEAIVDERSESEHCYAEFFAKVAEIVPDQKNFQIAGVEYLRRFPSHISEASPTGWDIAVQSMHSLLRYP